MPRTSTNRTARTTRSNRPVCHSYRVVDEVGKVRTLPGLSMPEAVKTFEYCYPSHEIASISLSLDRLDSGDGSLEGDIERAVTELLTKDDFPGDVVCADLAVEAASTARSSLDAVLRHGDDGGWCIEVSVHNTPSHPHQVVVDSLDEVRVAEIVAGAASGREAVARLAAATIALHDGIC